MPKKKKSKICSDKKPKKKYRPFEDEFEEDMDKFNKEIKEIHENKLI